MRADKYAADVPEPGVRRYPTPVSEFLTVAVRKSR